jgi:hypothetical protein
LPARTFQNCSILAFVEIPDSVDEIGDNAFYCCPKLGRVYLPESLLVIGTKAFYDCPELAELVYPYSMDRFYGLTIKEGNEHIFAIISAKEAE